MRKLLKRAAALALAVLMIVPTLAGCKNTGKKLTTPLVVGYSAFSQKFSPFFAKTSYDQDVASMVSISLMTTDRSGATIYNAIKGETTEYNGTKYTYTGPADIAVNFDKDANVTTYTIKMRDDLKFSDGEKVTADDIIFTYYVLADPTYDGSSTLYSTPIIGMQNYRTQTSDEVYAKYQDMGKKILAAGEDHAWSSSDAWTEEQQKGFWEIVDAQWSADLQAIVDTCVSDYASAASDLGFDPEKLEDAGYAVAFGMAGWGFAVMSEDGKTLTGASGKTWDIAGGTYPTIEDYLAEVKTVYPGGVVDYVAAGESPDSVDIPTNSVDTFISTYGPKDESMNGAGVPNISGIKKTGDYSVEVKTTGYDASAIYQICGITVAPMHYYGDKAKYDYDNNKFGFVCGVFSPVIVKTTVPMGAGAYKFVKYENKTVYFEANDNFYKGAPKIQNIQFKETADSDKVPGVYNGTIDVSDPAGSTQTMKEIQGYNSNGEVTGDTITTSMVDFLGYGYIGINANTVNVGGDPASEASKNLRKAFMTVLAVYRDVSIDSYYGELADVINYPISSTSWAAPQKSDDGYRLAYSVDAKGNDIYTSDMNADAKYDAALKAALTFFEAAGYTVSDGKVTAAPAGAKMEYEIIIGADGEGNHPSFGILTNAKAALEKIGITLTINDPADSNIMWDKIEAGTQEMWVAAWGATIDPDMYQVYHSSNIVGKGGTDSNSYAIADADLDAKIMDARTSDDQSYRKSVYKECLNIIMDWGVELPVYQRKNFVIFSTSRVNVDTLPKDITTYYGWMSEIETLENYEAK
ncbi:MAG: ABC transporter substrate-binding protein [Firmicutes bacterium]|nr:ABC transporter substrate-binding protein [Bacillota bacterium]